MHTLLVVLTTDNAPSTNRLQNIDDINIYYVSDLITDCDSKIQTDIILFDAQLGEENISQQISSYQQQHPQVQWLVFNMDNNIQRAIKYLQLGAIGILNAPYKKLVLKDLITSLDNKTLILNEDLKQTLALRQINKTLQPFNSLTSREFDVFCLLAENFTIQYIADNLAVSTKTAFNCQTQIRKKLGLQNQQKITQFAKTHSLIL